MASLRNIPAMDELLEMPETRDLQTKYNREFVVGQLRLAVDDIRQELKLAKGEPGKAALRTGILARLRDRISQADRGSLQRVVNGTGVVLHTNLGRAPLGERALENLMIMGRNYNNLEFDLEKGQRGSRYQHVEELIKQLTGAEAALVVNNNAAAVLLCLTALACGREAIVSRGQLIEIGGAFRIPDVMKQSGAQLIEVGTTNKTYISDYVQAITENTGLLFSAHTSNYKIVGFCQEVGLDELVELGKAKNLPVVHDLGSGILADLGQWGLKDEPTVKACVASGADLVTFSGDKLLGGPQAGIIAGKRAYIEAMKKHQLTRALRVDKLNLAALEGTLLEYLSGEPLKRIPVLRLLTASVAELRDRAELLAGMIRAELHAGEYIEEVDVVPVDDMVGGGAYPTYKIDGYGLEIAFAGGILEAVSRRMRLMNPGFIARKREDKMLISVRTLLNGDEELVVTMLRSALEAESEARKESGD
ncbi:MAG: L-seryl-tRNA(Sec) selenium transferase [Syntrophomonadaceae bacterium]|nr:L-seryl-tRNA(Sec) selenium transferase [Syntrophomonadaceae bacterium]